jgi:hypothetical protein
MRRMNVKGKIMTTVEITESKFDMAEKAMEAIGVELTVEQWLEIRKKAGKEIDPDTAEVKWWYAQTVDPYGVNPDLPDECWQVGREFFACAPGSNIWVRFGDLTEEARAALWGRAETGVLVDDLPL